MTNRFMISVAALALVAGTGFANAQGTGTKESGGGQQMQQNAHPSTGATERGSATGKERGTVGQAGGSMKSSAEEKSSGAMKDEKSSGTMNKNPTAEEKSGATKGERAQGQQDKSKGMSSESQTKSGASTTGQNRAGQTGATQTTGQAGAGAKLSTEQRTQITSVIHEEHVAPVTNVNFAISVGTRVPREGVEFHALPSRVVTIYPEWRSYKYILVRDEIVIIDPNTYEIVAVLSA